MFQPEIDRDKCTGCGECVDICPNAVLELVNKKAEVVYPEECIGCESCMDVCEQDAITVEEM